MNWWWEQEDRRLDWTNWVNKVITELQTYLRLIRFAIVNLELLMRYRSILLVNWFQEEVTALVWNLEASLAVIAGFPTLQKVYFHPVGQHWNCKTESCISPLSHARSNQCISCVHHKASCVQLSELWDVLVRNVKPWALQITGYRPCIFPVSPFSSRKLQTKEKRRVLCFLVK